MTDQYPGLDSGTVAYARAACRRQRIKERAQIGQEEQRRKWRERMRAYRAPLVGPTDPDLLNRMERSLAAAAKDSE